jgi:DNA sulfur modification protein DndB
MNRASSASGKDSDVLENVISIDELRGLARVKSRPTEHKSVPKSGVEEALAEGWTLLQENKLTVRLSRPKKKSVHLEDRVWMLLYKMGFTHLSGSGGAKLRLDAKNAKGTYNQIDAFGLDDEIILAIECKSVDSFRKLPQFQKDLAKHEIIRKPLSQAVTKQFALPHKRIPVLAMFTQDVDITETDVERARNLKIPLLNERDLRYYEELVSHLGPAAKYQFFADMLPGHRVHGLAVDIPALESKMGNQKCYTFSITPEYLLKIAYVSHRAKGQATDVDTYQRMIKKTRLKKIRTYITEQGVFPTNIVINFDGNRLVRFDKSEKSSATGAQYGTLHLTPAYKAAWIIDGQHRLFAYSGHERARTSFLNVLAFVNLPAPEQVKLFIDINHEQKSVKRSLLQELYAELHWESEDDHARANAIISKAIIALDEQGDSPFRNTVLLSDDTRSAQRCISLTSIHQALSKPGLFIIKRGVQYGPLWAEDNEKTLSRTLDLIKHWFRLIREGAPDWWDLGQDDGGGLAMNDGVTVCIDVLRSVFEHLTNSGIQLIGLSNRELNESVTKYGKALAVHFGTMDNDQRALFRRSGRGGGGQTNLRRQCEGAIHESISEFNPEGMEEALKAQFEHTNEEAYPIVMEIERTLRSVVVDTLKAEFGTTDEKWWFEGVPSAVKKRVRDRHDEAGGQGRLEDYFDLIHYRVIGVQSSMWQLLQDYIGDETKGNKEKRTKWIAEVNEIRKVVAHASNRTVTMEQLEALREHRARLNERISGLPNAATDV